MNKKELEYWTKRTEDLINQTHKDKEVFSRKEVVELLVSLMNGLLQSMITEFNNQDKGLK